MRNSSATSLQLKKEKVIFVMSPYQGYEQTLDIMPLYLMLGEIPSQYERSPAIYRISTLQRTLFVLLVVRKSLIRFIRFHENAELGVKYLAIKF